MIKYRLLINSLCTIGFLICLSLGNAQAQSLLKGIVRDALKEPIVGATIALKGTTTGTTTDANGAYTLRLANGSYQVVYSFVGLTTVTKTVSIAGSDVTLDVALDASSADLAEVVVVGSRASQRSLIDSPVPVDIISANDLRTTGQPTFDRSLQYRVPSFNTVNTPVNDATTLLDPWELRNMGPSRTLILINGKRKNLSSLLYVQFSPGRGETGVDISAIPQQAIKRVEILRDGASAQYGSDAIAGVMNIILKDKFDYTSVNLNTGVTSKGDGGMYNLALNGGSNVGSRGFVNYTVDFMQQNSAVRSGIVDVPTEIATFGGDAAQNALITNYLKDYPTANNVNGTGATKAARFLINASIPIGDKLDLYGNAAMVVKRVASFANYRPPYWRQDRGLLHSITDNGGKNYLTQATLAFPTEDNVDLYKGYIGYGPTFEGNLIDYNATVGVKGETNGWKHDASLTTGFNEQVYTVENTVNRTLGKSSPTRFKPGGYQFGHLVGNIDVSKQVTDKLGIAFGIEGRTEKYTILAGDDASYDGEGANSFPGINKLNAGTNQRFNIGAYADVSYDVTKNFLLNGTARTESYSDFGTANVWKLSSRYKFADDKVVLRASASTGFRAPTLHQIYAQSVQAAFVGGTIQLSGLFNNRSSQASLLGIPPLKPEKSTNYTVGLALNPTKNLTITLDYFNINVTDRIVYSSSISSSDPNSTLGKILTQAGVKTVQFFINGINTVNAGLDYVVSYRNISLGAGKLGLNVAGNIMLENKILGTPADPPAIKEAGSSILNTQIKSLLTESRPKYKVIFGGDYSIARWNINLNNTLFGSTSFQDLDNGGSAMENIKATFTPAVVTDLSVGYSFSKKVSATINVNNLLNVLPKWDLVALNDAGAQAIAKPADKALLRGFLGFSGRYDILGYNGSQFSQLGTTFNANVNVKF
ncbi:TonB-dependent receptor [Spirosoma pollinicola]|uniref:Ferric enterobactin receptor n=1 Tax=Spirosoma pollinicola TaxID=2057025 RepID=A0A2K8Z304_9BACT|nr:TonB-dependent receptor [Spirosoma pollinicola]AUD04260.1 ferric enterobactin receptor [Spirosoma pollinicola]